MPKDEGAIEKAKDAGYQIIDGEPADRWVYGPNGERKIVTKPQAEQYKKQGWSDTPATFKDKGKQNPAPA